MKLFKNSTFQKWSLKAASQRLNNCSGQAMIEYVLILIITVTMLFLAKGLFSSLNNYMTGYIGGYFRCLMTQGELPALGVEEDDLKKHLSAGYSCSVAYVHPPTTPGSGAGAGNIGTTKPLSEGATKATAASRGAGSVAGTKKPIKKKSTQGSGGGGGGDSDDSSRFSQVKNRSEPYSTGDNSEDEGSRVTSSSMAKNSMYDDKPPTRPVNKKLQDNIMKNTRGGLARRDNPKRTILNSEDDMRPGPRTSKLVPHQRGVATIMEEPETEMGFGYFMKWIMIAGIGIAIIIFFGSQVMNYMNSDSS